jgi:hypothetical protein
MARRLEFLSARGCLPYDASAPCLPGHFVGGIGLFDSGKTWLIVSDSISSWRLRMLTGRRMTRCCTYPSVNIALLRNENSERAWSPRRARADEASHRAATPSSSVPQFPGDCAAALLVGTSLTALLV